MLFQKQIPGAHLDRVNVVGDDDKLRLLLLDEGGDGVDAVPDHGGPLGGRVLLALSPGERGQTGQEAGGRGKTKRLCSASFKYRSSSRSRVKRPDAARCAPALWQGGMTPTCSIKPGKQNKSDRRFLKKSWRLTWLRRAPSASPSWPAWSRAGTCPSA